MKTKLSISVIFLYILFSGIFIPSAWGQTIETDTDTGESADDGENAPTPSTTDQTATLLQQLNDAMQAQQAEIEALKSQNQAQDEEAEQLRAELEDAAEEREMLSTSLMESASDANERKFSVFGFMDTTFAAALPGKEGGSRNWESPVFVLTKQNPTFYQNNINLYFKSEMTPTLETLIETRFTFQPNGYVEEYPQRIYVSGAPYETQNYWSRTDTLTQSNYSGEFRLGGIAIERAQFDWKPKDWLKIRMGRFLTPFGIWNEDHGSTVRLSPSAPFIVTHNYVPSAQTGIMAFGQIFIGNHVDIEYALTLSNGRGPVDEVYDLDKNKAMGLRQKINIYAGDFSMSAGAYGFMGQYTDSQYSLDVYLDTNGFDDTVSNPIQYNTRVTAKYDEAILAADLQFHFFGVHLLGEYMRGKVDYIVPTQLDPLTPLFIGSPLNDEAIEPNTIRQAWYAMAAYDLPFFKRIKVTPFVGIDSLQPSDVYDYEYIKLFQGGFNIKPSPYVALKSVLYAIMPENETLLGDRLWVWSNQVAVSF
ncbi:MAG: hypothetical protein JXX29_00315 [Deltaproteobacteria bacterium]|nr:hypothetical protein [Deltaproteobacteria bacterium]MBN2670079.1 hypothetical protein [Deltaproteobacteria bacterium]